MPRTERDSLGRTGCHNVFCEGHVKCPISGKDECGRVMVFKVVQFTNGNAVSCPAAVMCFGCGQIHNVAESGCAA
jgi:hypothetical protein